MTGLVIHERVMLVQRASADISMAVWQIVGDYDLTFGEAFMILGTVSQSFAKYLIREERHGDQTKEGGLVFDDDEPDDNEEPEE